MECRTGVNPTQHAFPLCANVRMSRSLASRIHPCRSVKQQSTFSAADSESRQKLIADLKACSSSRDLEQGRVLHQVAIRNGEHSHLYVASTLINMYAKCGSMVDAHEVFASVKHPNVVCWNALILGYAENGESEMSLDLLSRMQHEGCAASARSYLAALRYCSELAGKEDRKVSRERGKALFLLIIQGGCDSDMYLQGSLINLFAKSGCMIDARRIFESVRKPDVVCWTALIWGYAESGEGKQVLRLFSRMGLQHCAPNSITFVPVLRTSADLAEKEEGRSLERAKQLHLLALRSGCESDRFVQSTLLDMYAKCGSMANARRVFDRTKLPDVVSWTALILGYAENGQAEVGLDMFTQMQRQCCAPDSKTLGTVLKACRILGALDFGRKVHSEIRKLGKEDELVITNSLVDFYAKCGSMGEAEQVFHSHGTRSLICWSALMEGYARSGSTDDMFSLFDRMLDSGFRPDGTTFLCLLTACSHAGYVDKGKEYFELMHSKHELPPDVEHYTCMIDMLGRANQLDEAMALQRRCHPNAVTWFTVLGACQKLRNVELGKLAFECLISLDSKNAGAYVVMASIYGSRGLWAEQARLQALIQ